MKIEIYTDGGCKKNGEGAYAFTVVKGGDEIYFESKYEPKKMTNNKMELGGVINAVLYFKKNFGKKYKLTIFTDSQYVQKGITEWIISWKRNDWCNSQGEPVKNKKLWKYLDKLRKGLNIDFQWVRGHNGDKHNERADQLCTQAINTKKDIINE